MTNKILIPTPLRAYTDGQDEIVSEKNTVSEALTHLAETYTDLKEHLYDPEGNLRKFVNIFVNEDDVRHLNEGLNTVLNQEDTISIVPSIAGGL